MCAHCHVVSIGVEVKSLEALVAACERLHWTKTDGHAGYRWFGEWVDDSPVPARLLATDAEYKRVLAMSRIDRQAFMTALLGQPDAYVRLPAHDYDVGVYRVGDRYELLFDEWHGHFAIEERHQLAQAYAVEQSLATARSRGELATIHAVENGTIELRIQISE
jgi:hypothetical protein